jgi:hypothetical protein
MPQQKAKPGPPTQRYLDIAEIREDTVLLKDGTLRAVLLVSSINFALKSEDEQQAIIQGYMGFLNSLEHPLQVCIQSRRMNIDAYMNKLKEQETSIANELLRAQIRDYMSFVRELVDLGEIMQKRFFVVVPYDGGEEGGKTGGFLSRLRDSFSPALIVSLNAKQFAKRREVLMKRVTNIASGLESMGLQVALLDTQGLIELYYDAYNPGANETEPLPNMDDLRVEKRF